MKTLHIIILTFLTICLFISISGFCQEEQEENLVQMLTDETKPEQKVAIIYFKRHGILTRDAMSHFIIDRGDSLNLNSTIFQKKSFPPEIFNFREPENVKRLYLKLNDKLVALIVSIPIVSGLKYIDASSIYKYKPRGALMKYLKRNAVCIMNLESIVPNTNLLSSVLPGESFIYDRPEGTVQLQVIFPDGDQFFAQPFQVEAGKSYQVDYYLMPARIEVTEKK